MPQLSSAHLAQLAVWGVLALVLLFCLAFVLLQVRSRLGGTALYDMRLVEEKTARPAYRVRLRIFAFSTKLPTIPVHRIDSVAALFQCLSRQPFTWPPLMDLSLDCRVTRDTESKP